MAIEERFSSEIHKVIERNTIDNEVEGTELQSITGNDSSS